MNEIVYVIALVVAASTLITWFVVAWLNKVLPARMRFQKIAIAGLMPTLLIVAFFSVWHVYERMEYEQGPKEGFMSPLVFLIVGFDFVLGNLVINLAVASLFGRPR